MRTLLTSALALGFIAIVGCSSPTFQMSRSSDDVNICRQFIAEVGNSMLELKRDTFRPGDLTFEQLAILTPRDPDFVNAEFLALNEEWRFKDGGKRIVIVCAQGRTTASGRIQYFAGYESGEYGWIDRDVFAKLKFAEYIALPKVRPRI